MRPLRWRLVPCVLAAALTSAYAEPPPFLRSADLYPNPRFIPVVPKAKGAETTGTVQQVGEVAIIEGDSQLVAEDAAGNYAITVSATLQQPPRISKRFYTRFPDEFDAIVVFTTFEDYGAIDALAYEISAQQDVSGIGQREFDQTTSWGSKQRLYAFMNMMRWDRYREYDGRELTDPASLFYPVMAEEFAHRWLAFARYQNGDGITSTDMLGRAQAHWASTLQADASVMDGNNWEDHGDGTFTNVEQLARYSPLDLYLMGLLGAEEISPWFRIADATYAGTSDPVLLDDYMWVGAVVKGEREAITIDQVIAAEGPRLPAAADSQHDFRIAFVLVTRPGEPAAEVVDIARTLDAVRPVWEQTFAALTHGRASMCTQLSGPCGIPMARIIEGAIAERGGNGDGVIEPGEPVSVTYRLANDTDLIASEVRLSAVGAGYQPASDEPLVIAQLLPRASVVVTLEGALARNVACGAPLVVEAQATIGGYDYTFRGFAQAVPGLAVFRQVDFEKGGGYFGVNLSGADTTSRNPWAYGHPLGYRGRRGWVFQPEGGSSGDHAWFTGLGAGHRPYTDSTMGPGTTTLWSPSYDLSGSYRPSLHYAAWFLAFDFNNVQNNYVTEGASLLLEGSADRGRTWRILDEISSNDRRWRRRDVLVPEMFARGDLRLRFTATAPDGELIAAEAGIDDLELRTLTPSTCDPDWTPSPEPVIGDRSSCHMAGRSSPRGGLLLTLLLAAAYLLRRRHV